MSRATVNLRRELHKISRSTVPLFERSHPMHALIVTTYNENTVNRSESFFSDDTYNKYCSYSCTFFYSIPEHQECVIYLSHKFENSLLLVTY